MSEVPQPAGRPAVPMLRAVFSAALIAASATSLVVAIEMITRRLMRWRPMPWLPESPVALAALPLIALAVLLGAHALSRTGTRGRGRVVTASAFAALFASGVAVQWQMNARLQSDAFYYFAYLRSIAFDGDVDFTNDYPLLGLSDKAYLWQPPTATGYAHSAWTIGPAIVWAPFFGGAHLAAGRQASLGLPVATDGTSYPYRQAVCIAGLFYALLGTWFSMRAARQFFPEAIATTGAVLVVGGSFILWYALAEPTMTHAPTMAVVAAFVWYWTATQGARDEGSAAFDGRCIPSGGVAPPSNIPDILGRPALPAERLGRLGATRNFHPGLPGRRTLVHWIGLGALAGFAGLVRWQSVLFALLPAIEALTALWRASRARDVATVRSTLIGGVAFTVAAIVAFTPQMLAWKAIYGHYLAVSPVGPQLFWAHPHLVDVLFASQNGLFATSPILYVAAIGLVLFARRRPAVGVPALVVVAAMIYFNASIQDWWGSAGYGGRRFDGTLPLFVLGAAAALEATSALLVRRPRLVAAVVLMAVAVWNVTFAAAARGGQVAVGRSIDFGQAGASQARLLHGWIGHPFSYPANLWFAATHGVSPAHYDLPLTSFMGEAIRPFGRIDVGGADRGFLLAGWFTPEREGGLSFRWATQQAALTLPLSFASDLDLQIRLRAFPMPGDAQTVTVDTGAGRFGPLPVGIDWQTTVIAIPRAAWRDGPNQIVLTFSRVGRPGGGDTRDLSAAVDFVRVKIHD
ncbi:MAG: hypothetical protein ABIT71_02265 [Vicinamibacteraceae bacterium]